MIVTAMRSLLISWEKMRKPTQDKELHLIIYLRRKLRLFKEKRRRRRW